MVAFHKPTLLPRAACLSAVPATLPHLTRSALQRCLQRHGINRWPEIDGATPAKKQCTPDPLGYVHLDIAAVRTAEGQLHLGVAMDRTCTCA